MVYLGFLSLFFGASAVSSREVIDVTPGGLLLARKANAYFQPQIFKPLRGDSLQTRSVALDGLLQARQSCPGGYGLCSSGGCCPSGGDCCGSRKCCPAGEWCYSTGCCALNEIGCEQRNCCPKNALCCKGGGCCLPGFYCDVVDGIPGCCPTGKLCTSGPDEPECETASYVKCTNYNFCCPPGDVCFLDSDGERRCRAPSIPPPPVSVPSPTGPTPSIAPPPPLSVPLPPISNPSSSSPSTSVPMATAPSQPKPVPLQSPPNVVGSDTVTVTSNDARITWSAAWVTGTAPCNKTVPVKTCSRGGEKLSFRFSGATAVYVRANSHLAKYSISINGDVTVYGQAGETPPADCMYIWYTSGLVVSQAYTIEIVLLGPIELQSALWSFDFQDFALTIPKSSSGNITGNDSTKFMPSFLLAALSTMFVVFICYSL